MIRELARAFPRRADLGPGDAVAHRIREILAADATLASLVDSRIRVEGILLPVVGDVGVLPVILVAALSATPEARPGGRLQEAQIYITFRFEYPLAGDTLEPWKPGLETLAAHVFQVLKQQGVQFLQTDVGPGRRINLVRTSEPGGYQLRVAPPATEAAVSTIFDFTLQWNVQAHVDPATWRIRDWE